MSDDVKIKVKIDTGNAEIDAKELGDALKSLGVIGRNSGKQITDEFKSLDDVIKRFRDNVNSSGASFKNIFLGNLGANAVGSAFNFVTGQIAESVREAKEFSKAIAEINSVLPSNAKLTQASADAFKSLARAFATTPVEQARAFYAIVSSGTEDVAEATDILRAANLGALGSQSNVNDVATVLTSTLNTYAGTGLTAARATDILAKAVDDGAVRMDQLTSNLSKATFNASAVKAPLDDVAGAIAFLTRQGMNTAMATTSMANLFSVFTKQTPQSVDAFDKLQGALKGVKFNADTLANSGGLVEFFRKLKEDGTATKEVIAQIFGDERGRRAAFAILNQFEAFEKSMKAVENSAGAAAIAADKVKNSEFFKLQQAQANVDALQLQLGQKLLPVIASVVSAYTTMWDLVMGKGPSKGQIQVEQWTQQIQSLEGQIKHSTEAIARAKENGATQEELNTLIKEQNELIAQRNKLQSDKSNVENTTKNRKRLSELKTEENELRDDIQGYKVMTASGSIFDYTDDEKEANERLKEIAKERRQILAELYPRSNYVGEEVPTPAKAAAAGSTELSDEEKERLRKKEDERARLAAEYRVAAQKQYAIPEEARLLGVMSESNAKETDIQILAAQKGYLSSDQFDELQKLDAEQFEAQQAIKFAQDEVRIAGITNNKERELALDKLQKEQMAQSDDFYNKQRLDKAKQLADAEIKVKEEKKKRDLAIEQARFNAVAAFGDLTLAITGDNAYASIVLQKGLAAAQILVESAKARQNALATSYMLPAGVAQTYLATAYGQIATSTALNLGAVAASAIAQGIRSNKSSKNSYASGGIHDAYGGNISGDNSNAWLNSKEMVLTVQDQADLYYGIKNMGGFGGINPIMLTYMERIAIASEAKQNIFLGTTQVRNELMDEESNYLKP